MRQSSLLLNGSAHRRGETIMEVMVAVFILALALTAILSLVTYTVTGQQASEQQIIAQQLAREGIEVARNFRDSDALAGVPSSDGAYKLYTEPTNIAKLTLDASGSWGITQCTSLCDPAWSPPSFPSGYQLYFSSSVYRHNGTSNQRTPYARRLELAHICRDAFGNESVNISSACPVARVGTRVTSRVGYLERGQLREVALSDYLYDWK